MLVVFANNICVYDAPSALLSAVSRDLTIENPALARAKRQGRTGWGIAKNLYLYVQDNDGAMVLPRGYAREFYQHIDRQQQIQPFAVRYKDQRQFGVPVDFGAWPEEFSLRDYQKPFIEALRAENGVGVSPAGSGKTIMGLNLVSRIGRATVWLTHTKDLMEQSAARARSVLPNVGEIGLIGGGHKSFGDRKLIVATVQTLQRNPELIKELNQFVGCVVIDEAHHFPSTQFLDVGAEFTAARFFGLTATPARKDDMTPYMLRGIGPILYQVDRTHLYQDDKLVRPEVRFVYTDYQFGDGRRSQQSPDVLTGAGSVDAGGQGGDYREYLDDLLLDPSRQDLIAQHIVDGLQYGQTIVLGESVRYCFVLKEKVDALLASQGRSSVRTAVLHGGIVRFAWQVAADEKTASYLASEYDTEYKYDQRAKRFKVKVPKYTDDEAKRWRCTKKMRGEILKQARAGEIQILFATQLAREGLDLPTLCVGHTVTPKRGDTGGDTGLNLEQEIGRIMRPDPNYPDKKAVWYDYVDDSCGFFKSQYYSRRRVYKRLGIALKARPKRTVSQVIPSVYQDLLGWN